LIATLTRHPVGVYYRTKALSRDKVVINDQAPDFETLQALLKLKDPDISLEQAKRIGGFLLKVNEIVYKAKIREQEANKGKVGKSEQ
jgi:hypothetical protein